MPKKEIIVNFETITPLWIGDAWQDNNEIRPSALIGSLRFWFEVICYFSGICDKKDFKNGRFEKEVNRKDFKNCLLEKGNSFEAKIECLLKQEIPLPSIIFGSTNWRSLMKIKDIKYLDDFCFGNKLNLPNKICVNKSTYEVKEGNDCPNRSNRDWSVFYFANPYFYGKFQVSFSVEEKILESIFYPLLNFMDKYGFWGGKWNIGYGRLKIESVNEKGKKIIARWKKSDFELPDDICFSWVNLIEEKNNSNKAKAFEILKNILQVNGFYCKKERNFVKKTKNIPQKAVLIKNLTSSNNFKNLIQELLVKKVKVRNCLRHFCEEQRDIDGKHTSVFQKECFKGKKFFPEKKIICNEKKIETLCKEVKEWKIFRHKLLGELEEGSKILPFIYEENNELKGGLLSIAGLLNLEGESND